MAPATDNTTRFSSRVADYVSSRPSYPAEVVTLLADHFDLPSGALVADIGSGTGILSGQILDILKERNVNVIGIEPNKPMRDAGDEILAAYAESGHFRSQRGTAENTNLEDATVDLVVAAQAFHWFDVPRAREECKRILKRKSGGVALIWNERLGIDGQTTKHGEKDESFPELDSPVMTAYDLFLIRRGKDYEQVSHHKTVDKSSLEAFFGPKGFLFQSFPNPYRLDYDQLKGRLLSSSYTPQEGENGYEVMMSELKELFDKYQRDGKIDFTYKTNVFYGTMS